MVHDLDDNMKEVTSMKITQQIRGSNYSREGTSSSACPQAVWSTWRQQKQAWCPRGQTTAPRRLPWSPGPVRRPAWRFRHRCCCCSSRPRTGKRPRSTRRTTTPRRRTATSTCASSSRPRRRPCWRRRSARRRRTPRPSRRRTRKGRLGRRRRRTRRRRPSRRPSPAGAADREGTTQDVRLDFRPLVIYTPNHLLLDRSPNIGPLVSRWELDKFKICWNKSFRTSKILTLLYQQFSNLLISQQDMSGPRLGALSNNRWSGRTQIDIMTFKLIRLV